MSIAMVETLSLRLVLDRPKMMTDLRIRSGSSDRHAFNRLADRAESAAIPRALIMDSTLAETPEDGLTIDGTPFSIEKIRSLTEIPCRVFPFLATCGRELNTIKEGGSIIESFWLHEIMIKALEGAVNAAIRFVQRASALDAVSLVSPGSFPGWDIHEQNKIFALFEGHAEHEGINLNSAMMLVPEHSLAGLLVPCREQHDLCALCGSVTCPRRKTSRMDL